MSTATGDISLNAAGLANVSPFSDPLVTMFPSAVRVNSGSFNVIPGNTRGGFLSVASPAATTYSSTVEVEDGTGDPLGPVLVNASGNGYGVRCNFSEVRLCPVVNYDWDSQLVVESPGYSTGDLIKIELNESSGTLTSFINGQQLSQISGVSTTGLKAGVLIKWDSNGDGIISWAASGYSTGPDYTARKGSTETITHTLTADGITTATLDGETVTIGTQSGQDADIDLDETAITTSGEYDLVLGDGADTETFTVQYNVIGLATNTLQKEGDALADLSDVRITVLNAAGTRLDRQTGLTTNGSGVTGPTIVAAGDPGDAVEVSYYSASEEAGITFVTALELL